MRTHRCVVILLFAATAWRVAGQTAVDLTRQAKVGSGTTPPAQCAVGQIFLKTDAPTGSNLYVCLDNGWSVMGSSGGGANANTILNGSGAPSGGIGANGDFYLRTDTNCLYGPKAFAAWPGTCVSLVGPAGSGTTPAWTIVPFSSTPTFAVSSPLQVFQITLTGNVTSSMVNGSANGQDVTMKICEDGIGGRTFAAPTNFIGFGTLDTTPGVCNVQSFRYDTYNNFIATTKMRSDSGNPQLSENNGVYPLPSAPQAIVGTNDTRLGNARTPTTHAATHQNGGADEVATTTPAAYAIPKAASNGTLAAGWIPPIASGSTIPAPNITGHPTIEGVTSTGASGTGALVFTANPTLSNPNIGTATATSINKINLTPPTTAWIIQPAADNQTTIIPGGTLSTTTVSGSSLLKGSAGNAVAASAADVVGLFSSCSGVQYLGADGACHTASGGGGLADPGSNGILKRTALNTTTAAAATDVVGLFTSCSGTQYLGADGACHSASGSGTVSVVGSGSLTSTALVTGGSGQTLQTPSATATMDSGGNISTPGSMTTGAGGTAAGYLQLGQGSAPSAGTTAVTLYAPAAVMSYKVALPGSAASGIPHWSNTAGAVTESISPIVAADTDTSIAHTGVDINVSHQVTTTHLASALPVNQGGSGQTAYTDGQLLIGNTATGGLSKAALTAGSGITVTNGNGSISIASTGSSPPRQYGGSFGAPGGPAISTGLVAYSVVPQACTIIGYDILVDAGTATVKFWKIATGTALPTVSNVINTSGVAISTGTAIHSTTVSDFTTTAVAANDIIAMTNTASSGVGWLQAAFRCQ